MGAVFLAHQASLDRDVALKVVTDVGGTRSRIIERFTREATTLAKLTHPNIVPVYEVGKEGPYFYFAMEHVSGFSLNQLIEALRRASREDKASDILRRCLEGKFDSSIATSESAEGSGAAIDTDYIVSVSKMMVNVASALEYAHQRGVLHRDVKPSNILIDANGTPKLVDFGLARVQGQARQTLSGEIFGTPDYMSPEQSRSAENIDHRSDVYSLAATYYECLTLQPPFKADTVGETLAKIANAEPIAPKKRCPRLSNDFNIVLLHALQKSPEDRYQTAAQFAADIENILNFMPIQAKKPSLTQRSYRILRRNPIKVVALMAIALAAVLGYFVFSAHARENQRREAGRLTAIAEHQAQIGNYAQALAYFEQALESDPCSPELCFQIGDCCCQMGQYVKAREALELAVSMRTDYAAAYNRLGDVYNSLGQYQKAVDVFARVVEIDPTDSTAYANLGKVLGDLGRFEEAVRAHKKAIEINPHSHVAYNNLGIDYVHLARNEEAMQAFRDALTIDPCDTTSLYNIGTLHNRVGQYAEALEALQKASQIRPSFGVYNSLGTALASLGRLKEAEEAYNRAIEIEPNNPSNPSGYNTLGVINNTLGRYQAAIGYFRKAMTLDPKNAATYSNLAIAYNQLGQSEEAIQVCREAIRIEPNSTQAHDQLGTACMALQRYAEAVTSFEYATKADPNCTAVYAKLAFLYAKCADPNFRDAEKAVGFAQKACELTSHKSHECLAVLAVAYFELGDMEKTVELAQRACELTSYKNHDYLATLAAAHVRIGNFDKAAEYLKKAIDLAQDEETKKAYRKCLATCEAGGNLR
jgi:tetratricopeptide (TPR) repeat protein